MNLLFPVARWDKPCETLQGWTAQSEGMKWWQRAGDRSPELPPYPGTAATAQAFLFTRLAPFWHKGKIQEIGSYPMGSWEPSFLCSSSYEGTNSFGTGVAYFTQATPGLCLKQEFEPFLLLPRPLTPTQLLTEDRYSCTGSSKAWLGQQFELLLGPVEAAECQPPAGTGWTQQMVWCCTLAVLCADLGGWYWAHKPGWPPETPSIAPSPASAARRTKTPEPSHPSAKTLSILSLSKSIWIISLGTKYSISW